MSEEIMLPFCSCGCGCRVTRKGNKFIHGHNCGNQDKKHPGINIKPEINKFVEDNQGRHICKCGCGRIIEIKVHHFTVGIPEFIHGHNRKKPDVIKLCEVCGDEFTVKGNISQINKKTCIKECQYILIGDKNNGKDESKWHTCICHQCGDSFERYDHHISEKQFCCIKCLNLWRKTDENKIYLSIVNQDINPEDWNGFITWHRNHIINKCNCIKLNNKFKNSHAHHILTNVIIYIPAELHQSVHHNMKTGKNMEVINKLAFQYLNGLL